MPRILSFAVIAAMFFCVVLGNSRGPSTCPVHHTALLRERCEVSDGESVTSAKAAAVLKENPYAGLPEPASASIFPRHSSEVLVCTECRSNYLAATSLSSLYAGVAVESSAADAEEDEGALFRTIQ